jgi:Zinc-finger of C2H2 type
VSESLSWPLFPLRNPLKLYNATNEMAPKQRKEEEQGERIKVDGMDVKVKTPPPSKVRPVYYCQTCGISFPSQLDLDEHLKIDHDNNSKKDNVSI